MPRIAQYLKHCSKSPKHKVDIYSVITGSLRSPYCMALIYGQLNIHAIFE